MIIRNKLTPYPFLPSLNTFAKQLTSAIGIYRKYFNEYKGINWVNYYTRGVYTTKLRKKLKTLVEKNCANNEGTFCILV